MAAHAVMVMVTNTLQTTTADVPTTHSHSEMSLLSLTALTGVYSLISTLVLATGHQMLLAPAIRVRDQPNRAKF